MRVPTPRLLPLAASLLALFAEFPLAAQAADASATPLTLAVDLRSAPQRRILIKETVPVSPGPLTLHYPKWIPGEHAPSGPLNGVTGLTIRAHGQAIAWARDLTEMYDIKLTVPAGVTSLELDFQYIPVGNGSFGSSPSATSNLAELEWNQAVFYPAGIAARDLPIHASVQLPAGWQFATALESDGSRADGTQFKTVPLETLVDSPIFTGLHFQKISLGSPGGAPAVLNVMADHAADLKLTPVQIEQAKTMAAQAVKLAGTVHYKHYDFLFVLSDYTGSFGLEHHQSSDDRLAANYYTDPDAYLSGANLLPHEYFHSWNGKFRRPVGLATRDYSQPMKGDLLWVYEGMTNYYGEVLAARGGSMSAEQYRELLALTAATMQYTPGRRWRPLQDTADAAQSLYGSPNAYNNWRRSVDYYPEGSLLWLDVDTQLRTLSKGERSLDDFVKAFHGQHPNAVEVLPYDFDEVVRTLDQLAPMDWRAFLNDKLHGTRADAPLDGLKRGGWTLTFNDVQSDVFKAFEKTRKVQDQMYDVGLLISNDPERGKGKILDVLWDGPAFKVGVTPGTQLVAVNDEDYSAEVLREAITNAAKPGAAPIRLLVKDGSVYSTLSLDYHAGLRFPHLTAIAGAPDLISKIAAPVK